LGREESTMGDGDQQVRCAEYSSLRDELLRNKQYIFERPLAIVMAAGIASTQLTGQPSVVFLPLLLSILLLNNLWFTVNRLRSGARIAAYIAVTLEPVSPGPWVGWENALREYRIWTKRKTQAQRREAVESGSNRDAIPDAMMFYPPLWLLHLVTALVALGISACSLRQGGQLSLIALIFTFATTVVLAYFCIGPYHPRRMRSLIEENRVIWEEVLAPYRAARRAPQDSLAERMQTMGR
jgi:hypothetical protein